MPQSEWSAVDAAPDPRRLLTGLDALRADPFFEKSKERMAALLGRERPARVLDIGCGTGEDASAPTGIAIGIERSTVMCAEARVRHPNLPLIAADALALPISDASVDAMRADRVLQHIRFSQAALAEWRRVLRSGGTLVCFDPDLTTATVDGVSDHSLAIILDWRCSTRPGAATVHSLNDALSTAGFADVHVERLMLELTDLGRADGIMGLAKWGHAAANAGLVSRQDARRWSDEVHAASDNGGLRYRCDYRLTVANAR